MRRFQITYFTDRGVKDKVVSPHLRSKWEALAWLCRQKPYLWPYLLEIEVKEWQREKV